MGTLAQASGVKDAGLGKKFLATGFLDTGSGTKPESRVRKMKKSQKKIAKMQGWAEVEEQAENLYLNVMDL